MELTAPSWLWALAIVPVVLAVEVWLARRDERRLSQLVARPLWKRVVSRPAGTWRWARLTLALLGLVALVAALAGPRWGIVREKLQREGVDVVFVLDTSASMGAADVQPSRFFLARAALESLLGRLEGDRVALVALEGDAYTLVPLTLDVDAVGMFLDTLEPGAVPLPGTSLGAGLEKALATFVDPDRGEKAVVLVSDGEDLEGGVEKAIEAASKDGVVVHTVGVGTEQGAPVPELEADGEAGGFKKDSSGTTVVSRLHADTLERIAKATGGTYVRLQTADTSLWRIAAAVDGMEKRTFAREYRYRKQERYQWPLAAGVILIGVALMLPPPLRRRRRGWKPLLVLAPLFLSIAAPTSAAEPGIADTILLRPYRETAKGRSAWKDGDFPRALERFSAAAAALPGDQRAAFNQGDALYKAGHYPEAAEAFGRIAEKEGALAPAAAYNLGNSLYMGKDYAGAVAAYRRALHLVPGDTATRHNLELALRALEEQQKQQKERQQQGQQKQQPKEQQRDGQEQQSQGDRSQAQDQRRPEQQSPKDGEDRQQAGSQQRPGEPDGKAGDEEKASSRARDEEQQRFQREAGMPKDRAMQLLDALQRKEEAEQRRLLKARRSAARQGKDW